eukprot:SAG31_NODE_21823_length_540_cov_0.671202_1_plen_177_part_01
MQVLHSSRNTTTSSVSASSIIVDALAKIATMSSAVVPPLTSKTGVKKRMLRLAIGSRSQLCFAEDSFKLIAVVEQNHAYDSLDLPLLNRFEKQILTADTLLNTSQRQLLECIQMWANEILDETELRGFHRVFCGCYDKTLPSLILSHTTFGDSLAEMMEEMDIIRSIIAQIATPAAV